ncbi:MAG TPA: efflux RND transporter periplasmic adaptor subunit [Bacteroidia bacterium]|nr:efflux RND transporter periplasmic adaptor subunit [Bacteroidia bacterium]
MKKILNIAAPVVLFSLLLTSCSRKDSNATEKKPVADNYPVFHVVMAALPTTLRLPAQLNPFFEVSIYPRVTGYIKTLPVDIGSVVKEGQLLMEMEAPDVEQNSLSAQERYIKVQATYRASKDNYARLLNTAKTAGAVSPNDLQLAQSQMQSDSALCNSEKANWMAMESMKDYLTVRAPFDGTITQRNVHPGALVTAANGGKAEMEPLLELQQISKLRLQVKVPETFATQLQDNQDVSFVVDALPGKTFTGKISRQANSLDDKYRSETFEIDVINSDNVLMPGMYAEVLLPLQGHSNACIVPQSAVVTSTERKYVIKVEDNKAVLVNVTTGNEDKGMIEIFGDVKSGDSVIEKANDEIKQGQVVN